MPKHKKEIAEELCCNGTYNVACLLRRCKNCTEKQISFKEFDGNTLLQNFQWAMQKDHYKDKNDEVRDVKRTVKLMKTTTAIDLVIHLEEVVLKFMRHEAIILNQYSLLKFLKTVMKEDEDLIHMDLSENYCTKFGSEIQSALRLVRNLCVRGSRTGVEKGSPGTRAARAEVASDDREGLSSAEVRPRTTTIVGRELPGTSGEEVLIPKSPVSSRSGGLSPCLEIADEGLFKELSAVAVVINRSLLLVGTIG